MKPSALPLLLVLTLASAAVAEDVHGVVEVVREPAPSQEAGETVQVARIHRANGEVVRVTDPEAVDLLSWLEREQVQLEGDVEGGVLTVDRIVEPRFEEDLTGVLWSDKKGLSGRRRVELPDGSQADISGPTFLALYSLTKDLRKREIRFTGFVLKGEGGATRELVIMEVEARAKQDLVLSEPSLATLLKIVITPLVFIDPPELHGRVEAGAPVWVTKKALIGADFKVRDADCVAGYVPRDLLEIGRVVEEPRGEELEVREGVIGRLPE